MSLVESLPWIAIAKGSKATAALASMNANGERVRRTITAPLRSAMTQTSSQPIDS